MAGDIKLTDTGVVAEGGELHSSGSRAGFSFTDRTTGDQMRWVWYAQDATARLWSPIPARDLFVIDVLGKVGIGVGPRHPLEVAGDIHSSDALAGFSFADRTKPTQHVLDPQQGERWVWYAHSGQARLWSGSDRLSIHPKNGVRIEGNLQVTGAVTQASSIAMKDNVAHLSTQQALAALQALHAVTYTYKADEHKEQHVGFIAEDVPDLVAKADHTAVSPMDVVAVLTKVVQEQQRIVQEQQQTIAALAAEVAGMKQQVAGGTP